MKSQILLTVWCNISGGAGGEIWHWSLSGVKGLTTFWEVFYCCVIPSGILSGTSALLLTFDEAEVRKILAYCQNVIDYLTVSEQVETLQDLTTFVKNLTPGLSSMAKMVEGRERELTHQMHAAILRKCITSVKSTVQPAISALKTYVKIPETGRKGVIVNKVIWSLRAVDMWSVQKLKKVCSFNLVKPHSPYFEVQREVKWGSQ